MTMGDDFNQAVEDWEKHCEKPEVQIHSMAGPHCDCDAYRSIVAMGDDALPLIRDYLNNEGELSGWFVYAVLEITGGKLPEEMRFRGLGERVHYMRTWLNEKYA